ncbi:MAG: phage holin family protein [Ruminococcus sp.]|nr:phage holin family protein [Ruminococcus sp.]
MKYIIMMLIVLGLIIADYLTGVIKAYVAEDLSSRKMRLGGLNKFSEMLVMGVSVGFEVGMDKLGEFANTPELAGVVGSVTATGVFAYIALMEIISIFENYSEINPDAKWIKKFVKRLKISNENEDEDEEE